jgi:uncharacterized protein (DUF2235 family)
MHRPARNHVVIVDGTLSTLDPGFETHAGRLYKLLTETGPRAAQTVAYHPGVQGQGLRKWINAATGEGVNDAILHGYAALAARWRPGDRIFLFGYSRGAYAVRSLAGLIDRVGLVRVEHSAERRIRRAFHYYRQGVIDERAAAFRARFCHGAVPVEAVCCWDTVRALGLPFPILSRLGARAVDFHDDRLGGHIRAGYHALALDETRTAFSPVLWRRSQGWEGVLEQMWFPGGHADVGGDVGHAPEALPLAHLSLRWMLERAARHGLILPDDWRDRFPVDPSAPMLGLGGGAARLFLLRRRRRLRFGDGCVLHPAAMRRATALGYAPRAVVAAPAAEPAAQLDSTPRPA